MNFAAICHQIKAAKHVDRRYWWITFSDASKELLLFDVSTVFRRFTVAVGLPNRTNNIPNHLSSIQPRLDTSPSFYGRMCSLNGFQNQEFFFEIVLIVGPQDRGDFSRRCVECVGVAVFKKLRFLLGLPTIKVFSSDV
jgi:hypothetical protein